MSFTDKFEAYKLERRIKRDEKRAVLKAIIKGGKPPNTYKVTTGMRIKVKLYEAWKWAKGKKRLASNVLTVIGTTLLKAGETTYGWIALGLASFIGGVAIVEKTGDKLNQKTSGENINWAEVFQFIFKAISYVWSLIKSVFERPRM